MASDVETADSLRVTPLCARLRPAVTGGVKSCFPRACGPDSSSIAAAIRFASLITTTWYSKPDWVTPAYTSWLHSLRHEQLSLLAFRASFAAACLCTTHYRIGASRLIFLIFVRYVFLYILSRRIQSWIETKEKEEQLGPWKRVRVLLPVRKEADTIKKRPTNSKTQGRKRRQSKKTEQKRNKEWGLWRLKEVFYPDQDVVVEKWVSNY